MIYGKGIIVPSGGGGGLPQMMSAYADTEWTASGIVNSQYCAIPHELGVRPDWIEFRLLSTASGSFTACIAFDFWALGLTMNGADSGNPGRRIRWSNSSQSYTKEARSIGSLSHHNYADNTNVYLYASTLATDIVNGLAYKIIAYKLNIPAEWRGAYEYTTNPTT